MQKVQSESMEEWRQSDQESVYEWYDQGVHDIDDWKHLNAHPDQLHQNALFWMYLTHDSMNPLQSFCILCCLSSSILY